MEGGMHGREEGGREAERRRDVSCMFRVSSRSFAILAIAWLTCCASSITAFSFPTSMSPSAPPLLSVQDFKNGLKGQRGLVLDIDETLTWTVGFWLERMQKLFGNPEKLSVKDTADKYHLTQNLPYWQTDEAYAWMQVRKRLPPPSSPSEHEAQEELPVIEGVKPLQED